MRCKAAKRVLILSLERLESRQVLSSDMWLTVIGGISPGGSLEEQAQYGQGLLGAAGISSEEVAAKGIQEVTGKRRKLNNKRVSASLPELRH